MFCCANNLAKSVKISPAVKSNGKRSDINFSDIKNSSKFRRIQESQVSAINDRVIQMTARSASHALEV